MASVVIAGNTSGTVTLNAPDIAGTTVLTLPTTSGTLVTTAGGSTVPFALGSAASPSITFTGDTNTGIFSPGADTIGFAEGGAEVMRIDSSGNVQVGMTSGARKLNVQGYIAAFNTGGGNDSHIALYNDGTTSNITSTYTSTGSYLPMAFQTGGSERMRINSSGVLSVGGTTSYGNTVNAFGVTPALDSGGLIFAGATDSYAADKGGQVMMGGKYRALGDYASFGGMAAKKENSTDGNYAGYLQFLVSNVPSGNVERMRIVSSGEVLIGKTTTAVSTMGVRLGPDGSSFFSITNGNDSLSVYNTSAGAYRHYVTAAGTIFATSTTISAISDQRLKENVVDLDVGLDAVMALKPRKFDWKEGKGKDTKGDRGFIAQEFETVFPDLVDEWKDPSPDGEEPYKSVRADLIPILVKAIQEQQAIINEQASTIAAFEARLVALENK